MSINVPVDGVGRIPSQEAPRALFVVASAPRERALFRVVDWTTGSTEPSAAKRPRRRPAEPLVRVGRSLAATAVVALVALIGSVAALAAWTTYSDPATQTLVRPTGISAAAAAPNVVIEWDAARLSSERRRAKITYIVTRYDDAGTLIGPASCGIVTSTAGRYRSLACHDVPGAGTFTYRITASYGGLTAVSAVTNSVTLGATTTTVTPSADPASIGQPVALTAAVASAPSGTPTGEVEFFDGQTPIDVCGGAHGLPLVDSTTTCYVTYTSASDSPHALRAIYLGDATYTSSTSATVPQNVVAGPLASTIGSARVPTSMSLASSSVAPVVGERLTLTATLSADTAPARVATASGTVEFLDGGTTITGCAARPVRAGVATCVASSLAAGDRALTAVYSGDPAFLRSSADLVQSVLPPAPRLIAPSPAAASPVAPSNPSPPSGIPVDESAPPATVPPVASVPAPAEPAPPPAPVRVDVPAPAPAETVRNAPAPAEPAPQPAPAQPVPPPAPVRVEAPAAAPASAGTVRNAPAGQMNAAINASVAGDTVICTGGAQPKLTLSKSFPAPGITVRCDSSSYFQGIDTNGQSGFTFDGITSQVPVAPDNYDVTPFYMAGTSERIKLTGAFKLRGGYDGIKVYGGCKDCTIDDGGAASDISGYGGDGIHINQAVNLRINSVSIGSPWQGGPTPEHNDGIHAQAFTNLYIGPGVRIEALGPRSDVDSAGIFIQKDGGSASNFLLEGAKIRWQIGRGMQVMWIDGSCVVRNVSITDSGVSGESPPLTIDANGGQKVDLYGIAKSDVYFNSASAESATVFH